MNFLRRFALQGKKHDDSSRLDFVEIARVPDMLPSLFLPDRAKDLTAPGITGGFDSLAAMIDTKNFVLRMM